MKAARANPVPSSMILKPSSELKKAAKCKRYFGQLCACRVRCSWKLSLKRRKIVSAEPSTMLLHAWWKNTRHYWYSMRVIYCVMLTCSEPKRCKADLPANFFQELHKWLCVRDCRASRKYGANPSYCIRLPESLASSGTWDLALATHSRAYE